MKMKAILLVLLACIVGFEYFAAGLGSSFSCIGHSCYGGSGGNEGYGGYGKIGGYGGYGRYSGGPGWWYGGGTRPRSELIFGGGGYSKFHGRY
ncbi:hypothetical protein CHS0354_019804 [Potamilus streckersoni]|uniref:Uncharacterized protein n=1 Tax=Potamilus streckersoni TaxID=2493646 RepID=A0AAE0SUM0_9BIVA|nr:hypothetical protein CHS0354_019804 [Potamilus streckersoni]